MWICLWLSESNLGEVRLRNILNSSIMKRTLLLIFPLLLISSKIYTQPAIQWQKALGGSSYDGANSIFQTSDNGFVTTGQAASDDGDVIGNHGGWDFWVVKMDSSGIPQWKKTYGGSNNDWSYSIIQTTDEGYVVVGFTESNDGDVSGNHGDKDMWVIKLDGDGAIQWQKSLGGSGWEEAWSVRQCDDGGYIVAGRSSSTDGDVTGNHGYLDYWVVKLSISGDIEWQKSFGGSGLDLGYAITKTSDGGYVVTGESDSKDGDVNNNHGNSDYWVVKMNFEGKIEWERSFGGTSIDRGNDILQTREGGYVVFGQTRSINGDVTDHHGGYDWWVVKLDETGELEWQKTFGGSDEDFGQSIKQTVDGGFVLGGFTHSTNGDVMGNQGNVDAWILKLTEGGEIQWQKALGGTGPENGYSIQQTDDGGYIMSGDAWVSNGDVSGTHGKTDFWIIKLSPESSPTSAPSSLPLAVFPNPAQQTISLKTQASSAEISTEAGKEPSLTVRITDLLGREVSHQAISDDGQIDISALPNSLYLLTATTPSGKVFSGKFRKQE